MLGNLGCDGFDVWVDSLGICAEGIASDTAEVVGAGDGLLA